ncbi:glycoside hydrolase family 28 protein [Coleophoma crateriformis]|uniref:Glycoside hydrolase family 28 protein n=1 Tax=Coleophoma crateriformis TaxID=565419 RepID=A0A3D8SXI5_9HELO|nr:glycoside hydrolase family 28 protein [Coleophoma crateriformis]
MYLKSLSSWLILSLSGIAAGKTCTMPKNSTVGGDDAPGITAAVAACGSNSTILFSGNETYNLLTPLSFRDLSGVKFSFEGNISLSQNITEIQAVVNNTKIYPGHWITVKGSDITFSGSKSQDGGWFLAHGQQWWSAGNQIARPHWFTFSVTGLVIEDLKILKPIAWVFSIKGSDVTMTNTYIDARSDDDGIDLSGNNVLIDGFECHNGDDMVNVSPDATNVTVRNVLATGTHGIAVSCSSGTAGNYLFEDVVVKDSLFGARFKGSLGTTCNLSNVTWRNFEIHNTSYPIHFIENYVDQEKGAAGMNASVAAYANAFSWENITGSASTTLKDGSCITDPCWSYTEGIYSPNAS